MIEKLPNEILSNVATYLSPKRISICVRVCRSWYAAFIPTLYEHVEIKTRSQFDEFLDSLRTSDTINPINPLGHFVRKLNLFLHLNPYQVASLPRLCPFVIELNCSESWGDPTILEIVHQWKYIKSVGPLSISTGQDSSLHVFRNIVTNLIADMIRYPEISKCITELPCIEELTLTFSVFNPGSISLRELETLHKSLPRLRSLKIFSLVIDGEMPEQITPCDSVSHLYLDMPGGLLWGQYFARKYKNLKKLDCSWSNGPAGENIKTEVTALARSCRRLEHFYCSDFLLGDLNQQCIEILHTIGAPLTYFYLDLERTSLSATTISNFHKTLSKMDIGVQEENQLGIVLEATRVCIRLVDLALWCVDVDLEVGHILSCCKNLKYLILKGRKIRAGGSYSTDSQHDLRTLNIQGDIDEGVFPYLSERCPRMFSLSCGFSTCSSMPYLLYFPSPSLEILRIQFYKIGRIVSKVTRVSKPEEIVHYNTSVNERQTEDSARWFYKENDSVRFPVKELVYRQPGPFSDQPRDDYAGWGLQNSQENSQHQKLLDALKDGNIIRIICHYVDQIYLNKGYVRY